MEFLRLVSKWLFILSIIVWGATFFLVGNLPPASVIQPELHASPRQAHVKMQTYDINYNGKDYKITDIATYQMVGLVLAHNDDLIKSQFGIKNAEFTMRNLCVIYGDELKHGNYSRTEFNNCPVKDGSNNYLLSDNEEIRREIGKISIGDQIYIKGRLVNYESNAETLKSSTKRDDGAAEIIFVEEVVIGHSYNFVWALLHKISLWTIICSFAGFILFSFARPSRS